MKIPCRQPGAPPLLTSGRVSGLRDASGGPTRPWMTSPGTGYVPAGRGMPARLRRGTDGRRRTWPRCDEDISVRVRHRSEAFQGAERSERPTDHRRRLQGCWLHGLRHRATGEDHQQGSPAPPHPRRPLRILSARCQLPVQDDAPGLLAASVSRYRGSVSVPQPYRDLTILESAFPGPCVTGWSRPSEAEPSTPRQPRCLNANGWDARSPLSASARLSSTLPMNRQRSSRRLRSSGVGSPIALEHVIADGGDSDLTLSEASAGSSQPSCPCRCRSRSR